MKENEDYINFLKEKARKAVAEASEWEWRYNGGSYTSSLYRLWVKVEGVWTPTAVSTYDHREETAITVMLRGMQ